MATTNTPNILSTEDPLPLKIRLTKDGNLSAEINGRNETIIKSAIGNPRSIKYFSLGSWGNLVGKWFLDCEKNIDSELNPKADHKQEDSCCCCCN